jgi:hypothetical protein
MKCDINSLIFWFRKVKNAGSKCNPLRPAAIHPYVSPLGPHCTTARKFCFGRSHMPGSPPYPFRAMPLHVRMVIGATAVLQHQGLLQELAHRFDQAAVMHGVEHFLKGAGQRMTPILLLVLADDAGPLSPDNIVGAALFYEFRVLGLGSGIFVTEGKDGFRSVIAPEELRGMVAGVVSTALLEHRAHLLVTSYIEPSDLEGVAPGEPLRRSLHWAAATRSAPGYLLLRDDLEATIDLFNKKTRRNFRYYRRRLQEAFPLEFVAKAAEVLTLEELQAINRSSLEPVAEETIQRRLESFGQHPDGFLCGLRSTDGRWFSLIGGWRHQGTSVLQWQMNVTGYEEYSLVTVARSFWLEHEIALGTRMVRLDGGTNHAMNHSFVPETAVDLILRRRSLRSLAMVKLGARLLADRRISFGRNSFLAETLTRPELQWRLLSPVAVRSVPEPQYATDASTPTV